MIEQQKAQELHRRYEGLEFHISSEGIASGEGLKVVIWPFLSPVDEMKVGGWQG